MIVEKYGTEILHHVAVFLSPKFKHLKMLNDSDRNAVHEYVKGELISIAVTNIQRTHKGLETVKSRKADFMITSRMKMIAWRQTQ